MFVLLQNGRREASVTVDIESKRDSMNSNFVDYVKILVRSGKGGAGSAHLLRVKYNAKAGPDGGDGGRGGHVILRGSTQRWTLLHLKYTKHVFA